MSSREATALPPQIVSLIQIGRAHASVPGPISRPPRRAEPLTVEQVADIKRRVDERELRTEVARAFGISPWTVAAVMSGRIPGRGTSSTRTNTQEEVREIRSLYESGLKQRDIAERFGLTQQAVSQIVRGAMYLAYGGPTVRNRRRRLTSEDVGTIRKASASGTSLTDLADRHHVTQAVIKQVVAGVTYPDTSNPTLDAP